jgi:hypothetical protein
MLSGVHDEAPSKLALKIAYSRSDILGVDEDSGNGLFHMSQGHTGLDMVFLMKVLYLFSCCEIWRKDSPES